MDTKYNIILLNNNINDILKSLMSKHTVLEFRAFLSDVLNEKDTRIMPVELIKYDKKTLKLLIERNILLSMENNALKINKSYLKILKNSASKFNVNILHHYFDLYMRDIKNDDFNYMEHKNINDIKELYDKEIEKSMNLISTIDNISSIDLDHMKNLNANGRTISINSNGEKIKKGGIFLSKNSNITYGKFVNKNEFLEMVQKNKSIPGINIDSLNIKDLKVITKSLSQVIKIEKNSNVKNQDARLISSKDKKLGSLFLGNKGTVLPNGEYVSLEEITFAINKFVNEKNSRKIIKPTKIIKFKNKIKESIVVATMVASSLVTAFASKDVNENKIVYAAEVQNEVTEEDTITSESFNSQGQDLVSIKQVENNDVVITDNESNYETISDVNIESNENNDVIEEKKEEYEILPDINIEMYKYDENIDIQNEMIDYNENVVIDNEMNKEAEETIKEEITNSEESFEQPSVENDIINEEQTNPIENNEESNIDKEIIENNIEQSNLDEKIENNIESENISMENDLSQMEEYNNIDYELNNEELGMTNNQLVDPNVLPKVNGTEIADFALQFVGNPYSYGGTSLTDGIDCSGFTSQVFSNFGVDIPRTSGEQSKAGENIGKNIEDALPGDLICFDGHVGIYIGNGQMVHAANKKRGIVINDVDYDKPIKNIVRVVDSNIIENTGKTL